MNIQSILVILQVIASLLGSVQNGTPAQQQAALALSVQVVQQIQQQMASSTPIVLGDASSTPDVTPTILVLPPLVVDAPTIEVVKDLREDHYCKENAMGTAYCDLYVYYFEDGKMIPSVQVSVSADDQGQINADGKANVNTQATRFGGFPAPGGTSGPVAGAWFQYTPNATGTRTMTVEANGVSQTITVNGAK